MNTLTLVGTVTTAPEEIPPTEKAKGFTVFNVESPNPFKPEYPDRTKVKCYGKTAEGLTCTVGNLVAVVGKASSEGWINKETKKASSCVVCIANSVETLTAFEIKRPPARPSSATTQQADDSDSVPF